MTPTTYYRNALTLTVRQLHEILHAPGLMQSDHLRLIRLALKVKLKSL